jgi:hypothetical protein
VYVCLFVWVQVMRPWCHFELPESDYISGGRRNPELPGPSGSIEPLDPATKVRGPCPACTTVHAILCCSQRVALVNMSDHTPSGTGTLAMNG